MIGRKLDGSEEVVLPEAERNDYQVRRNQEEIQSSTAMSLNWSLLIKRLNRKKRTLNGVVEEHALSENVFAV